MGPAHLVVFWLFLVYLLKHTHLSGFLTPWNSGISTSQSGSSPSYPAGSHSNRVLKSHPGVPAQQSAPLPGPRFHLPGQVPPAPVPYGLVCLLQELAGCFPGPFVVWSSSFIRPRVPSAELRCNLAPRVGSQGAVSGKGACCFAGRCLHIAVKEWGCWPFTCGHEPLCRLTEFGEILGFKIWGTSTHLFLSHVSGSYSFQPGL